MNSTPSRQLTNPPCDAEHRRRGLALRYVGDDAIYNDHPGTSLESPQMKSQLPDLGLQDREPFRGDLSSQVWPQSN
jgi:hypothetical protein